MTRTIEVLFFDGCPNFESTVERVRGVAEREPDITFRLVRVESVDEAQKTRFLGSPSVRIDGVDVDPSARERSDYGLQCRVYPREQGGFDALPPVELIRAALAQQDRSPRGTR